MGDERIEQLERERDEAFAAQRLVVERWERGREALRARASFAEARVAELERENARLREAATSAMLNALAWMSPDLAHRYREDSSYRDLAELLAEEDKQQ